MAEDNGDQVDDWLGANAWDSGRPNVMHRNDRLTNCGSKTCCLLPGVFFPGGIILKQFNRDGRRHFLGWAIILSMSDSLSDHDVIQGFLSREAALVRGLMSEAEWAFFEPFVVMRGRLSGRPAGHRRTLDGIFWVARTGAPWRDLPEEFGRWNSVYRQFLRWSRSGLWDLLLEALASSGGAPKTVQMIDSTVIRAHHQAAGAKGGLKGRVLVARAAASRVKSMPVRTARVSRLVSSSHRAKHTMQLPMMN
jgi:transposase